MAFATTKHLRIRAYRESDKQYLLAQENDQRAMSKANPTYVVPMSPNGYKEYEDTYLSKALMLVIVEVKKEYAHLRKWDEAEKRIEGEGKKQEDWDRELYAGSAVLHLRMPKNRDASLGIIIAPQWQGNGFGTELIEWIVQHAFEQLNLHRVSLDVYAQNASARRVYEKCGFVVEGITRKAWWRDGRWEDAVVMGILDEEYFERKKQQSVAPA